VDAASTENWMDFMKKNNLTHCNWSINHKDEGASALDEVLKGNPYIDSNIASMLEIETWMHVSKREREVIELLIKGITQKEVADQLYIAPKTVAVHVRNLFDRFHVKNTTEMAVKYVKYKTANRENIEDSIPPFKK